MSNKWEFVLVLLIITTGILITTIIALKWKADHPLEISSMNQVKLNQFVPFDDQASDTRTQIITATATLNGANGSNGLVNFTLNNSNGSEDSSKSTWNNEVHSLGDISSSNKYNSYSDHNDNNNNNNDKNYHHRQLNSGNNNGNNNRVTTTTRTQDVNGKSAFSTSKSPSGALKPLNELTSSSSSSSYPSSPATEMADDSETIYLSGDYETSVENIFSNRLKVFPRKKKLPWLKDSGDESRSNGHINQMNQMNQDDLISTSETRTGDTSKANVAIDFRQDGHGLPGFPAPIGFVDGPSRQSNSGLVSRLPSAEFTTDGAGFILGDDLPPSSSSGHSPHSTSQKSPGRSQGPSSPPLSSSSSNVQPQSPIGPGDSPSGPISDEGEQPNSFTPTRIIYQEVAVPVPVPVEEGEEEQIISPFRQSDSPPPPTSSNGGPSDAVQVISSPNLPYGTRYSLATPTRNGKEGAISNQKITTHTGFRPMTDVHGKERSQQKHNSIGLMSSTSMSKDQMHQQKSHPSASSSSSSLGRVKASLSLGNSGVNKINSHPHPGHHPFSPSKSHMAHKNIPHVLKSDAIQQQVNSLSSFSKSSNEQMLSAQPSIPHSHQISFVGPSSPNSPYEGGGFNLLTSSNEIFDERNLLRPQINLGSNSNFMPKVLHQHHQNQIRLPSEATYSPSSITSGGNGQKLPVFIKSDSNDKLTSPIVTSPFYIPNGATFDQEMSSSNSNPSISLRASEAEYSNDPYSNSVKESNTKNSIESNTIPLGMPLAGILLHRQQQQQQQHQHQQQQHQHQQRNQIQKRQSEASVSKSLNEVKTQQHSPSTTGSSVDVKSSLVHRFAADILTKKIIGLETSVMNTEQENKLRFKRQTSPSDLVDGGNGGHNNNNNNNSSSNKSNKRYINNGNEKFAFESLSSSESRFIPSSSRGLYGGVNDGDSMMNQQIVAPSSIYDIGQPDYYHLSSSRRRLTHTGSASRRNHHRRNSNPSGSESKSFGLLGSGNFEVIRGGIYKGSNHDSSGGMNKYGGSHTSHTRPHLHHLNVDEYEDAVGGGSKKSPGYGSSSAFGPGSLGDEAELFNSPKDPVFGFQGYDNFHLASNQEEELKKHDSYLDEEDHTSSASNSHSTSFILAKVANNHKSIVKFDQDLMAIA